MLRRSNHEKTNKYTHENLKKAVRLLKSKYPVNPDTYAVYRHGFLIHAYRTDLSIEFQDNAIGSLTWYLVSPSWPKWDIGPMSPAFDVVGFFEAVNKAKPIPKDL